MRLPEKVRRMRVTRLLTVAALVALSGVVVGAQQAPSSGPTFQQLLDGFADP